MAVFAAWAGYTARQVSQLRGELTGTVRALVKVGQLSKQVRNADEPAVLRDAITQLQQAHRAVTSANADAGVRVQQSLDALRSGADRAMGLDHLDGAVTALRRSSARISSQLGGYWTSLYIVLALSLILGVANVLQLLAAHRAEVRLREENAQRAAAEAALAHRNRELAAANRELDAFAAAAAHELKEPLASIQQCAMYLTDFAESDPDTHREMVGFIAQSASRLDSLVVALFDYARAGKGAGARQNVPLTDVLADARQHLAQQLHDVGATITAGELPTVTGDRAQLAVLLQNALSNAVKFRGDQPLQIDVRCTTERGEHHVEVQDNGVGIADADAERVFEAFTRAGNAVGKTGAGIGLSTCKRIVENHGGRIWLRAEPEGGAVFSFTLPAA